MSYHVICHSLFWKLCSIAGLDCILNALLLDMNQPHIITFNTWSFYCNMFINFVMSSSLDRAWPVALECSTRKELILSRNLKGELGLFLSCVFIRLWGSGQIDCHIWRRVVVPSDLAQSFGTICSHYRYRVIHRTITNMPAWLSPHRKGNSCLTKLLGRLNSKKIPKRTITHLHKWWHNGRHNRFLL